MLLGSHIVIMFGRQNDISAVSSEAGIGFWESKPHEQYKNHVSTARFQL